MMTTNNCLKKFHVLSVLMMGIVLTVMVMSFSHPLYLLVIGSFIGVLFVLTGNGHQIRKYAIMSIWMMIPLICINVLMNRQGQTVIWAGPSIPVFGPLLISLESLIFSIMMFFKLFLMMLTFVILNSMISGDEMFSVMAKYFPQSGIIMTLTALLIPQMKNRLRSVYQAMSMRGAKLTSGTYLSRARNSLPLLKSFFISSLEDSWSIAQALHVRGFGLGKRTCYQSLQWNRMDGCLCICFVGQIFLMVFCLLLANGSIDYFPKYQLMMSSADQWVIIGQLCLFLFMIKLIKVRA